MLSLTLRVCFSNLPSSSAKGASANHSRRLFSSSCSPKHRMWKNCRQAVTRREESRKKRREEKKEGKRLTTAWRFPFWLGPFSVMERKCQMTSSSLAFFSLFLLVSHLHQILTSIDFIIRWQEIGQIFASHASVKIEANVLPEDNVQYCNEEQRCYLKKQNKLVSELETRWDEQRKGERERKKEHLMAVDARAITLSFSLSMSLLFSPLSLSFRLPYSPTPTPTRLAQHRHTHRWFNNNKKFRFYNVEQSN